MHPSPSTGSAHKHTASHNPPVRRAPSSKTRAQRTTSALRCMMVQGCICIYLLLAMHPSPSSGTADKHTASNHHYKKHNQQQLVRSAQRTTFGNDAQTSRWLPSVACNASFPSHSCCTQATSKEPATAGGAPRAPSKKEEPAQQCAILLERSFHACACVCV